MPPSDSEKPAGTAPWETRRDPSGKRFLRGLLPWLGGIFLLALVAWGLWPKPVVVEIAVVARGPLTVRISEEGRTRVRNRYIVAAPLAGKMRRVALRPGDEVAAGETLLTAIEPLAPPLLDPRARATAEAAVSMQEAARKQAAETLEVRRVAASMAETDRNRLRGMTERRGISQFETDRLEGDAAMRAAELRAAEFSLQVIDYELAQARAALARPEGDATDLVEVKSPVSGRVLRVIQESATVVTPGMPILEIGDPADIEIEAEILSRDAVVIHPGDPVEVDQWGGDSLLAGRVRRVEPAAFTKISALGVEEQRVIVLSDLIDPPPAAKALGDRYRVEVRVGIWHADDALIVPAGALFRQGDQWMTYLFRDGKALLAPVRAGHSDGRFTEILGGIDTGARLLLHPPDTVADGAAVTARKS